MDGPGETSTDKRPPSGARWVSWLWPVLFILLLLLPLGSAATFGYHRQKALIRERVLQSLELLAFYKRQALTAWYERTRSDAEAVLALPGLKAPVAGPGQTSRQDREALLRELGEFARAKGFSAVRLVGADGAPLEGLFAGDPAFACPRFAPAAALGSGAPSLTPLHREGAGPCHMEVVVPLPAISRPFPEAVAILLTVDPRKDLSFNAFLVSMPQGISGAEISLVQRTGDHVNVWTPSRSQGRWPDSFEVPYSPQSPIWLSVQGQITRGGGLSPEGVPGLFATHYVFLTGWGIVAQIDEASAFSTAGPSPTPYA